MKDAYTFNRSSLIKAKMPVPKFNENRRSQKMPVELEEVKQKPLSKFSNKSQSKNKINKKLLLNKLQKKEYEEKNAHDK